jgi:hypothetical protein
MNHFDYGINIIVNLVIGSILKYKKTKLLDWDTQKMIRLNY